MNAVATTHRDDVPPWDIRLDELEAFGWTAAAAVRWACYDLTPAQVNVFTDLWEFGDQLLQRGDAGLDWREAHLQRYEEMKSFLAGPRGRTTGFALEGFAGGSAYWHAECRLVRPAPALDENTPLRWTMRAGANGVQPFLEYLVSAQVDGRPLTVHVHPSSNGGHLFSYTWSIRAARGHRQERRRLQRFDAEQLDPIVLIDNAWDSQALVESVIAQLIDWHFRVRNIDPRPPNCPAPTGGALDWWISWLQRVSGNRDVGLDEALTVAKRSVRPAIPAGHHTYWRQSLRRRSRNPIEQACSTLGISRTAAYRRLTQGGRSVHDFQSLAALVAYLRDHDPKRRLADDQRAIIDALTDAGMQPEAARKLERRTRGLPPEERHKRLQRALDRHRRDQ